MEQIQYYQDYDLTLTDIFHATIITGIEYYSIVVDFLHLFE